MQFEGLPGPNLFDELGLKRFEDLPGPEGAKQEIRWPGGPAVKEDEIDTQIVYGDDKREEKAEVAVNWKCKACMKTFSTKQSLGRHLERFILCKEWKDTSNEKIPVESAWAWAQKNIENAIQADRVDGIHCRFCNETFANIGNLHRHFSSADLCNRLAYTEIKSRFATHL